MKKLLGRNTSICTLS